ncbi:hypothetical protein OG958_29910 [Micromonospora sp. NBC_01813]|nr:hypothetical protein [Micromonospora sp. NBC_01813]WSA12863.1 hypothetical protein OG958_29910 [Micromonospora sp. NBC_01813]
MLARQVDLLIRQVSHWEVARWAVGGGRRAADFHHLVQDVADLGAAAEGRPGRPVPRLRLDTALPDQLRVVTADLISAATDAAASATDVAVLETATAAVRRLRAQL